MNLEKNKNLYSSNTDGSDQSLSPNFSESTSPDTYPENQLTVSSEVKNFLTQIKIPTNEIEQSPQGRIIYAFLEKRIFDSNFRSPQQQISIPEEILTMDPAIPAYIQKQRESQYIVAATFLGHLIAGGGKVVGVIDVGNVFGANEVPASPKSGVGDLYLQDVVSALETNLGDNFYVVRCDGDEFATVAKNDVTEEDYPTDEALAEYVGQAERLYMNNAGEAVYDHATVKVHHHVPIELLERKQFTGYTDEERKQRLTIFHPEVEEVLQAIDLIPSEETRNRLLQLIEVALYDPLLQEPSERLSQVLSEQTQKKTTVHVYRDRTDFIEHLYSQQKQNTLIRIDLPSALKQVNDSYGYDEGNILLNWEFTQIASVAAQYTDDIRIYRRGADMYLAFPQDLFEQIQIEDENILLTDLEAALAYETMPLSHPDLLFIANAVSEPYKTAHLQPSTEKLRFQFNAAIESLAVNAWQANVKKIRKVYQNTQNSSHWLLLANMFNPFDKRGALRIARLNITDEEKIQALRTCYQATEDEARPYTLRTEAYETFIGAISNILEIPMQPKQIFPDSS